MLLNKTSPEHYYSNLYIPENFDNLEHFMLWYLDNGLPIIPPKDADIFYVEDASTVSIFRHKNYQVEFYIVHPNSKFALHSHPGVDLINFFTTNKAFTTTSSGRLNASSIWGTKTLLMDGQEHADIADSSSGYTMLAFEYWKLGKPTSVTVKWKGKTVSPRHDALIEKYYPGAVLYPGYADTTNF